MRGHLVLLIVSALFTFYAMKDRLLYTVVDTVGLSDLPSDSDEDSATAGFQEEGVINSSAAYRRAVKSLRYGDFRQALETLRHCTGSTVANADGGEQPAQAEDVDCQRLVGEMHLTGAGVQMNVTEGLRRLTEIADAGDADAQFSLGVLHANLFEGDPAHLRRNEALSVLYLYAASVAGHPGALMAMGYRHAMGYGVPQACNTAALNYIEVARRVAAIYSTGMPQAVELVRLGIGDNEAHVMSASEMGVFVELAASGDANIAAAVGKRYLLGIQGFRQDFKLAKKHLRMAAEKSTQRLWDCSGMSIASDWAWRRTGLGRSITSKLQLHRATLWAITAWGTSTSTARRRGRGTWSWL